MNTTMMNTLPMKMTDGNILEYDGNDAHWQDDEWDVQSTYNGSTAADDMPSSDAVFDTEEFDRVYAAYADSKRQLNQLRVRRGFFPVVALTDGGKRLQVTASGSHSQSRSGSSQGKSEGKGKGKKGSKASKFKGPSSPKKGMSSIKERGDHMSSMMCLRCGMFGHMAAELSYQELSATLPGKKCPADGSDNMQNFVGMAQHLISDANNWVAKWL